MALFLQHKTESMQWAVWKVDESIEMLISLLPEARKAACEKELGRFTSEHRKREWLSVRVLLHTVWREDAQIDYTSDGKPFLTDGAAFISVSHTKGYVAVMLAEDTPVGIDIEQYGQRIHKVVDRFVRPDEQIGAYQEEATWSMLLHWSAKEAVFKCMEKQDADLRKLCLSHFVPQEEGSFQVQEFATAQQQIFTVGYRIHPDFVLTWTMNVV